MLRVYRKFYRITSRLYEERSCYELICNLVKWGEGGVQYDSLMSMPFDEILNLHTQANRINKETKEAMDRAK